VTSGTLRTGEDFISTAKASLHLRYIEADIVGIDRLNDAIKCFERHIAYLFKRPTPIDI
jgi:hypothetical protein